VPVALQVSGLSQTVSDELPHAVPAGAKASAGQLPAPSQFSGTSHAPALARQTVVPGSLLGWHTPFASQVSGLSQTVSDELPHAVPAGAKASAGQLPAPSQFSGTSHAPALARQTVVPGSLLGWHTPFASQVSGLSQTVSDELPHAAPVLAVLTQPVAALQVSVVQPLLSSHAESFVVWEHVPLVPTISHESVVQAIPSSQSAAVLQPVCSPTMSIRLQLHFEPVPGSVSSAPAHTPPALCFQLVQELTSAVPSLSESLHSMSTVNVKMVKRHVPPPPPVHGPVTLFPHGFVF
jgi:hypothetical protein